MSGFPPLPVWHAACATDPVLANWAGDWSACFAIAYGDQIAVFTFEKGALRPAGGTPSFTLSAPAEICDKFLLPVPPRHYHGMFAMMYRLPDFRIADGFAVPFHVGNILHVKALPLEWAV